MAAGRGQGSSPDTSRAGTSSPCHAHVAGPGPSWVSLGAHMGDRELSQGQCRGLAHRKWLSTVSFWAFLGSPVMNSVRLTCQRDTPGRKVTRTNQSVGGPRFPTCSSLPKQTVGAQRLRGSPVAGQSPTACSFYSIFFQTVQRIISKAIL